MNQTRIVVLDDVSMTEEQQARLTALGDTKLFHGQPECPEEIYNRLQGADICVLGWTSLDASMLARLPRLRFVSIWATGTNYVDLAAAKSSGIVVSNVPGYSANAVAEMCLGFMIALSRSFLAADQAVRAGRYRWQEFCGVELSGKTLGIVGMGAIGTRLAALGFALGMRVISFTKHPSPTREAQLGVCFVELDRLLSESDYVSLNCSLNTSTNCLMNRQRLAKLQQHSYLINSARAGLVDEVALVECLETGSFAGAALDDLDMKSPIVPRLTTLSNVILSPHIGFHTKEATRIKTDICVTNVEAFIGGAPVNVVSQ